MSLELTKQQVEDFLVTAIEGGSNYWADFRIDLIPADEFEMHKGPDNATSVAVASYIWAGGSLRIDDAEGTEDIDKPLTLVHLNESYNKMYTEHTAAFSRLITEEYDVWDTDILIQVAVLGEIVFG